MSLSFKNICFILVLGTTLSHCNMTNESEPIIESGVSRKLNEERKQEITELAYNISLTIPEDQLEAITGSIQISCKSKGDQLIIDFQEAKEKILRVSSESKPVEFEFINQHIFVPLDPNLDQHVISIDFIAGDLSLNRNEDFLYTLFVPDRASTCIPLIDQPNLKATYQLRLTIPEEWDAIANGPEEKRTITANQKTISFGQTKPISTYLFAFATGVFQRHDQNINGVDVEFLFRENDPEKIARNVPEIVQLHIDAREWLEAYTGIPYPFKKYGWATFPPFQYGGMEHPGAIFYRESSLFLDESATTNQKLGRASLIAHEVAHMWCGDLVTMDWFDDVWLKEVFANFMAAKMVQPNYPEIDHETRFLLSHYPSAYSVDRTKGANAILQPLDNLKDAGSMYGAIIYHKAPIVMQMLENKIGEEEMQAGLRTYLNEYAFGNAIWDDLIRILDKDGTLQPWSDVWVKEAGMADISIKKLPERYSIESSDPKDRNRTWSQEVNWSGSAHLGITLNKELEIDHDSLLFDYPNVPYGNILLSDDAILDQLENTRTEKTVNRAYVWIVLREQFIHGKITSEIYERRLKEAIERESDPLVLNFLLSLAQQLYGQFDQEALKNSRSTFEETLWNNIHQQADQLKKYYHNCLVGIMNSQITFERFEQVLLNPEAYPIRLSNRDKQSIVYQLALFDRPGWEHHLSTLKDEINNVDLLKRIDFTSQFLTNSDDTLDQLFANFEKAEARANEPWVLDAMRLLNHPNRQPRATRYIKPGLVWLEDIQKTGDIFFPKRWLDALLSQHNSKEAVLVVENFLKSRPDYPEPLKKKILQAYDLTKKSSLVRED